MASNACSVTQTETNYGQVKDAFFLCCSAARAYPSCLAASHSNSTLKPKKSSLARPKRVRSTLKPTKSSLARPKRKRGPFALVAQALFGRLAYMIMMYVHSYSHHHNAKISQGCPWYLLASSTLRNNLRTSSMLCLWCLPWQHAAS